MDEGTALLKHAREHLPLNSAAFSACLYPAMPPKTRVRSARFFINEFITASQNPLTSLWLILGKLSLRCLDQVFHLQPTTHLHFLENLFRTTLLQVCAITIRKGVVTALAMPTTDWTKGQKTNQCLLHARMPPISAGAHSSTLPMSFPEYESPNQQERIV